MIGLAMLAWHLAWKRAYGIKTPIGAANCVPWPRSKWPELPLAEKVYYPMIDRIARGEKP
jgi:hypothetical protein